MSDFNGVQIKDEPVDPLLDVDQNNSKDFLVPGNTFDQDSDCEELQFFTQVEVDNTRKCLENTRLIIKDFETQLDWHLQQYITLRNIFGNKKDGKRQDLLSISQLSAIIANHPEGNKKFIKRKVPVSAPTSGAQRRKRKANSESEESEDDSEEYDEEDSDSENEDNPKKGKKDVVVKDEIDEEYNELIVPKEEPQSEDDEPPPKPRGKKGKKAAKKPAVDVDEDSSLGDGGDVKDELDKEELAGMLQDKLIFELDEFDVDEEKPIHLLSDENILDFDVKDIKSKSVIIAFEDPDQLPEFMFTNQIAKNVLNGNIKAVEIGVFDMYNDSKN